MKLKNNKNIHTNVILIIIVFLIVFVQVCPSNAGFIDWVKKITGKAPKTVLVTFEIQLINATATSWGYGIVHGKGNLGFGASNEVLRGSFYAKEGQDVFAKAYGRQWSRKDPGHQIICRILVGGEEIYMDADLGTPNDETEIYCRGPVYIPKQKKNR